MLRRTKPRGVSYVHSAILNEKALYYTRKRFNLTMKELHTLMLVYEVQRLNNGLVTVSGLRPYVVYSVYSIGRKMNDLYNRDYLDKVKSYHKRKERSNKKVNVFYSINQKGMNVINWFQERAKQDHDKFNDKMNWKPIKPDTMKYYDSIGIMYNKHNIKKDK